MQEQIEVLLPVRFGLVPQSMERVRNKLARWARFLQSRGVTDLDSPWAWPQTLLTHLVLQEREDRGGEIGHYLRNLIGLRPYKP